MTTLPWTEFIQHCRNSSGLPPVEYEHLNDCSLWNAFTGTYELFMQCKYWAKFAVLSKNDGLNDKEAVLKWLKNNCKHNYKRWNICWFIFEDKNDALLFKTAW